MLIAEKLVADENDARDNLDALVRQRGEHYEPLSRFLGKPANYLRRWVRGEIREPLPETLRYDLARYFGVDARVLGAPNKTRSSNQISRTLADAFS